MTVALLFLTGYQFWGDVAHERIFQVCIDVLTLFSMIALIYSSIVLSRYVFAFLPIEGGMALARRLHILGSYWGFLLMNIHLGLHWNMVIGMVQKRMRIKKSSRIRSVLLFFIGTSISPSHSLEASVPGASTARWENQLSGAAPCQCFTPAGILTTSPGFNSCASLPHS